MIDLEAKTHITQQDLKKSRKDFEKSSLLFHFGGEVIGGLYYTFLRGITLPCIQTMLGYSDNLEPDYKSIGIGLAVYAIPQLPAFFLKGLAMTQNENNRLAKKFAIQAKKEKERGKNISSWTIKKMSNLHYHFSVNSQKYEKITHKYTEIKKGLSKVFPYKM